MRLFPILFVFWVSQFGWANSLLPDTTITVYTTQSYSITHQELADQLYFLDAVSNLEEQFGKLLSPKPQLAEQQVRQLLQSKQGQIFQKQLQQAYVGIVEGWKTGVMKVPAIVFDDAHSMSVIYGESNVEKAIQLFRSTMKEK